MRRWMLVVSLSSAFVVLAGAARAEDIGGDINSTLFITENSRLVGHVTCTTTTEPCIELAASHITLDLNGFTITGPASPEAGVCNATSGNPQADGIRIRNVTNVSVIGPGMIQKFRRHGVFVVGIADERTRIRIKGVTSHHNCFSGLFFNTVSYSVIEESVSIRNGINSTTAPCGGNCMVNSHNNVIRRNAFTGNGAVANNNNDFGIGLVSGSSGNLIEDNTVGGNTNGVLIQGNASGNVFRRNAIVGNPPVQVTKDHGVAVGFDVKDEAASNGARNTFEGTNWCISYSGPGPAVCPNLPK